MAHSKSKPASLKIGVISDTHGLIRPQALLSLRGSNLIVHCGDVGKPEVLDALGTIAPVRAVRGNNDRGEWAAELPAHTIVEAASARLYVIHNLAELDFDPAAAGFAAVLCGHSHRPRLERKGGVLYLNPGSAGPRRFSLPIAAARMAVRRGRINARIIYL